jgi:hypothetical protein
MMTRTIRNLLALAITAGSPCTALAQPVELPKWDISSSFGILDAGHREEDPFSDDETVAWNLDVGRYLTPHLKLDGGLMLTRSQTVGRRIAPIGGLPPEFGYFDWALTTVHPTSISGAFTYQFRDNEFLHPYLSAGVRTIWQAEHTLRVAQTIRLRGVDYAIPGVDERTTSVIARPFVAVGCKSYFNSRAFMRPEVLVAFGPSGYSHSTWRIGAGVDF